MSDERSELHDAFIEAYPVYVAQTLGVRGIAVDDVIADAVVEGTGVLDRLLASLEDTPILEQRSSPLEAFREALRPVERALALVGAPEPGDVPGSQAAWDRFGLAPGSSQVLGSRAHEAHLAWGVRKATAMAPLVRRPRAIVMTTAGRHDELVGAVEGLGYAMPTEEGEAISVALVDVGLGGLAHEAIRRWATSGAHVVAFGDDVDDLSADGLRALGARVVVSTRGLLEDPASHLPSVA